MLQNESNAELFEIFPSVNDVDGSVSGPLTVWYTPICESYNKVIYLENAMDYWFQFSSDMDKAWNIIELASKARNINKTQSKKYTELRRSTHEIYVSALIELLSLLNAMQMDSYTDKFLCVDDQKRINILDVRIFDKFKESLLKTQENPDYLFSPDPPLTESGEVLFTNLSSCVAITMLNFHNFISDECLQILAEGFCSLANCLQYLLAIMENENLNYPIKALRIRHNNMSIIMYYVKGWIPGSRKIPNPFSGLAFTDTQKQLIVEKSKNLHVEIQTGTVRSRGYVRDVLLEAPVKISENIISEVESDKSINLGNQIAAYNFSKDKCVVTRSRTLINYAIIFFSKQSEVDIEKLRIYFDIRKKFFVKDAHQILKDAYGTYNVGQNKQILANFVRKVDLNLLLDEKFYRLVEYSLAIRAKTDAQILTLDYGNYLTSIGIEEELVEKWFYSDWQSKANKFIDDKLSPLNSLLFSSENDDTLFSVWYLVKHAIVDYFGEKFEKIYETIFNEVPATCSDYVKKYAETDVLGSDELNTLFMFVCYLKRKELLYLPHYRSPFEFLKFLCDRIKPIIKSYESVRKANLLKKELMNTNGENPTVSIMDIDLMTGQEFEEFIGDMFKRLGYSVSMTKATGDQGIDVILEKGNLKIGIQTKCYTNSVGNAAIQEAVAGKAFYSLDRVMVITNSHFTSSAVELAKANGVVLWDRETLISKL